MKIKRHCSNLLEVVEGDDALSILPLHETSVDVFDNFIPGIISHITLHFGKLLWCLVLVHRILVIYNRVDGPVIYSHWVHVCDLPILSRIVFPLLADRVHPTKQEISIKSVHHWSI